MNSTDNVLTHPSARTVTAEELAAVDFEPIEPAERDGLATAFDAVIEKHRETFRAAVGLMAQDKARLGGLADLDEATLGSLMSDLHAAEQFFAEASGLVRTASLRVMCGVAAADQS